MATASNFIEAVIPYVILVIAVFLLYRPLKEPLQALWSLIAGAFSWIGDKKDKVPELIKGKQREIEYS